jgi:hypothetical protein
MNAASLAYERIGNLAMEELATVRNEQIRPSVLLRPAISLDGAEWCALYGENLQDGVAGYGDSPAAAFSDFDRNWHAKVAPSSTLVSR